MKRRSFLQRTSVLLAAWGASELGLSLASDRYQQVLAQPTNRKLALLIGINQYRNASLNGCLTDIELQKELLIHRFGFQSSDIVTLINQQATRSRIETAFTEHLIQQAKSSDVVVFHFSGYGNLQKLGATADDIQPTFITADEPSDEIITNGLPQDTLFLLLRSLPTDQITTVLDAGYFYPGYSLQGNLRLRSHPTEVATQLTDAELAFQEEHLAKFKLDRSQVKAQWRSGQMPGVVLSAASSQQFATETSWNGFSAGLFTYALTQQLWQATPKTTLRISLSRTSELISKRVDQKQQPFLSGKKSHDRPLKPYHLSPTHPPADGVITGMEESGKIAQLWLGGLPPQVLEQYSSYSLFTVETDSNRNPLPLLQLHERLGLNAKARFVATDSIGKTELAVGQQVQEAIRVLPRNIGLSVAIDTRLGRIERVDAISAFSAIPHVSAIVAGEQAADYVFGKVQETTQVAALNPDVIAGVLPPSGYGLFSEGRNAIPNTKGNSGEAVKLAVRRLAPQLQGLLAVKLLNLTVNEGSSQLGVRAALGTITSREQLLIQQQTDRVSPMDQKISPTDGELLTIPIGNHIQYHVDNTSNEPVYFLVLGIDNGGQTFVFNNVQVGENLTQPTVIAASETVTIPILAPTSEWIVRDPIGLAETYLICSRAPFKQTRALLASSIGSNVNSFASVRNFLEVAQTILQDLHQASDQAAQWVGSSDVFALDVNAWTTFRFIYQVV